MKKALFAIAAIMIATSANGAEKTFSFTALHDGNIYVIDSNLSGMDCVKAISASGNLIDLDGRTMVPANRVQLACELEKPAAIAKRK